MGGCWGMENGKWKMENVGGTSYSRWDGADSAGRFPMNAQRHLIFKAEDDWDSEDVNGGT